MPDWSLIWNNFCFGLVCHVFTLQWCCRTITIIFWSKTISRRVSRTEIYALVGRSMDQVFRYGSRYMGWSLAAKRCVDPIFRVLWSIFIIVVIIKRCSQKEKEKKEWWWIRIVFFIADIVFWSIFQIWLKIEKSGSYHGNSKPIGDGPSHLMKWANSNTVSRVQGSAKLVITHYQKNIFVKVGKCAFRLTRI